MSNGVRLSEVTEADCGLWIASSSVRNPVEFSIAIVDLAVSHGFEVETEAWEEDRVKFIEGEYSFEMLEDLSFVTDVAVEFLQDEVAEGFYFDFDDGLVLYKDTDLDDD